MYTTSFTRVRKTFAVTALVGIVLFLCFMVVGFSAAYAQEKEMPPAATTNPPIPVAQGPLREINPYFSTQTITYSDGTSIDRNIINGPPTPPPGYELERTPVALPEPNPEMGTNTLTVPAFDWVFGCSSVSAAMIAGYYDRNGYANMYTGPTNVGVMPLDNSSWPLWNDGYKWYPNLPLAASKNGVDGRVIRGSIDDYWVKYGSSVQDPYISNGWTQHAWGTAIGDYMKTSQSAYDNTDGSTTFWNYTSSSAQLTCADMVSGGISDTDGTYGRKLFYEARGYTVTACYSQKTDNTVSGGFSFAQYKAEIDAGRPVMLNLAGHTIAGVGYNDPSTVYIHDTWDYNNHSFTWGTSYSGMQLLSVSIVNLVSVGTPPTVTTGSATNVTSHSATLNSTINPNGLATACIFYFGKTLPYGNTTAGQSVGSGTSNVAVSADLTRLTPNTTYHYRPVASNSLGAIIEGSDMTFTTKKAVLPFLNLLLD